MSGSGRSKKLRIVREYLATEGKDLDVVVFSDATDVLACVEIKILRRVLNRRVILHAIDSTRRLLDSVVVLVPHRSTEPARPRHRRKMT